MAKKISQDEWMKLNSEQFTPITDSFGKKSEGGGTVIYRDIEDNKVQVIGIYNKKEEAYQHRSMDRDVSSNALNVSSDPLNEPKPDDSLHDWFIYFHKCKLYRKKITLKDITIKTGIKYEYIRKLHSEWKVENNIE